MARIEVSTGTVVFTASFLGVAAVTGLVLGLEARYTTRQQPILEAVEQVRADLDTMDRRRNAQYGELKAMVSDDERRINTD